MFICITAQIKVVNMKINNFWNYFKIDIKLFLREPLSVLFTLLLPVIMFYLFGIIYESKHFSGNLSYVQRFLPSQISLILYAVGGFTLGFQISNEKYLKIYKRLSISPISLTTIMISAFIKGLFIVIVALVELCLVAVIFFNENLYGIQWFEFIISTFCCAIMFFSFGFMIASITLKPNQSLTVLLILFYPMNMLSGSMFPIEQLPHSLKFLSKIIPQTYTNQILISTWKGNFYSDEVCKSLIIIIIFTFVFIFISKKNFKWVDD